MKRYTGNIDIAKSGRLLIKGASTINIYQTTKDLRSHCFGDRIAGDWKRVGADLTAAINSFRGVAK